MQIESSTAIEALPEIGLKITIGTISVYEPKLGINEEIRLDKSLINPEAFNKLTHNSIPNIEGKTSLNKDQLAQISIKGGLNTEHQVTEKIITKIINKGIKINDLLSIQ